LGGLASLPCGSGGAENNAEFMLTGLGHRNGILDGLDRLHDGWQRVQDLKKRVHARILALDNRTSGRAISLTD
jgi:hypothetical protein